MQFVWSKKFANKPSSLQIFGFHHICFLNNGEDIANEQINKIKVSGLYDATTTIFCTLLGDIPPSFVLPEKYEIIHKSPVLITSERTILEYMYNFSKETNGKYWYIHTKGVTRYGTNFYKNVESWRRYMEYFVLIRWRQCIADLDNYEVAGVSYTIKPKPHFSGNFWWSRGDYIQKNPTDFDYSYNTEVEMWLFKQNPRYKTYHQTNFNHYLQEYPPTHYNIV
jgi:hypothetical protein